MKKDAKLISKEEITYSATEKKIGVGFSRKQLCIPYFLFLVLFVIFPLLVVVFYAFTSEEGKFTFYNFAEFFTDKICKNVSK